MAIGTHSFVDEVAKCEGLDGLEESWFVEVHDQKQMLCRCDDNGKPFNFILSDGLDFVLPCTMHGEIVVTGKPYKFILKNADHPDWRIEGYAGYGKEMNLLENEFKRGDTFNLTKFNVTRTIQQ